MFNGIGTALITPFNTDFSVDYESLRNIVRMQIEGDVDYLVVLGTTGEAPVVSVDERRQIIQAVLDESNHEIPIVVGTGSNDPVDVAHHNQMAEELGCDGLLIVTPYYNKGTQSSLHQYFEYIAGLTKLPIILYNVPSRTGVNLLPETVFHLFENAANIVAIKEATSDFSQINRMLANRPDGLMVLSGNDDLVVPMMSVGGNGVISVASNIIPKTMAYMVHAAMNNEITAARTIHNDYLGLMQSLFLEVNPIPVKYAAAEMGLCQNILRLPLAPMSQTAAGRLKSIMQERGVL